MPDFFRFLALNSFVLLASAQVDTLEGLERVRVLELKAKLLHVQGIDLDGTHLWVTSVDAAAKKGFLQEFVLSTGELVRSVEVQDGPRFHPGGMAMDRESLWIPVAEYKRSSTAVVQQRNKKKLALEAQWPVADHIGCVAVAGDSVVGGNWDSRDLYEWDRSGVLRRKVANPTGNGFQDLKFSGNQLVGSGLAPGRLGAIDWMEFPSLRPVRRLTVGKTDRGEPYTREGMAIRDGLLYLLPEDGASRLFVFRLR